MSEAKYKLSIENDDAKNDFLKEVVSASFRRLNLVVKKMERGLVEKNKIMNFNSIFEDSKLEREIKNLKRIQDFMEINNKTVNEMLEDGNAQELESAWAYTTEAYNEINRVLRAGKLLSDPESAKALALAKGLISAIKRNKLEEDNIFYRGVRNFSTLEYMLVKSNDWKAIAIDGKVLNPNKVGSLVGHYVSDKAVMSFTVNKKIAYDFMKNGGDGVILFKVLVRAGTDFWPIMRFSQYDNQEEILLEPKTKLKIDSAEMKSNNQKLVLDCTVV